MLHTALCTVLVYMLPLLNLFLLDVDKCIDNPPPDSGILSDTRSTVVDGLVIFISVVCIFLCARSLLYSVYLCKTVYTFFIKKFNWRLKAKHLVPLFNLWFVGTIVSNGLVLVGSIMKLVIAYTVSCTMYIHVPPMHTHTHSCTSHTHTHTTHTHIHRTQTPLS